MQNNYKVKATMSKNKLQVWLPLILAAVMISGMFFGFKLHQQTGSQNFFQLDKTSTLQETMDLIKSRYVDSVQLDSLRDDAINAVMEHLDPHSVYIPATNVSEANEELQGGFEGIGVEFNLFNDTVNVIYVIPDGPSEKAGLRIGDKIIAVNETPIVSKILPVQNIRKMIRGRSGTDVSLKVLRGNSQQTITVTRGRIPLPAVDATYMIDATTGYIRLNKFSETAYKEFMQSIEKLKASGMQKLIFDLRGNGGGYVAQAVNIADEFLDGDKLIVYTQGTNIERKDYRASKDGVFEKGKLVVLVDELSASASEILAGALQDWDRASIVGRRTFGKGLVQEQYSLSDGSAIRLTIARYFTHSGRSIQRPYDKGKKIYMEELRERYENGETINPDSMHVSTEKKFKTNGGRTVYGGGGITPDVYVPVDTSSFTHNVTRLYLDGRFNAFVYQYYITHQPEFQQYKTAAEFAAKYQNTQSAWNSLVSYALKDSIYLEKIPQSDRKNIEERIKAYLARLRWRSQGFYEVYNTFDPIFKKGKEAIKF
ncbi:MAG TPA: S41 family peptidase [Flavisolibacter sp.]|nr:S41 family peptidase [Flavisolibacter sp.]